MSLPLGVCRSLRSAGQLHSAPLTLRRRCPPLRVPGFAIYDYDKLGKNEKMILPLTPGIKPFTASISLLPRFCCMNIFIYIYWW